MAQSDTLRKLLNPPGRPQPSAAGDRDLAAEADLLQFKKERRKFQRALSLIVKEKRMRGLLPAFGGPEVYQALAVGTRACDASQDMKDAAWLAGAPELAFGGKCPTADQWLAGEAPQEAEVHSAVQRDIGGSTASAWKGRPSDFLRRSSQSATETQPATGGSRLGSRNRSQPATETQPATGGSRLGSRKRSQTPARFPPAPWMRILVRRAAEQQAQQESQGVGM